MAGNILTRRIKTLTMATPSGSLSQCAGIVIVSRTQQEDKPERRQRDGKTDRKQREGWRERERERT